MTAPLCRQRVDYLEEELVMSREYQQLCTPQLLEPRD